MTQHSKPRLALSISAFLTYTIVCSPLPLAAEEAAIGYIEVPQSEKQILERRGESKPVIVGGEQGEVWPEYERSYRASKKFPLFELPDERSERLTEVDVNALMFTLVTESSPGSLRFSSPAEQRSYESGKNKLLIYEKRGKWLRVKFRDQPPFNGRSAWLQLSNLTGGFVAEPSK